MFSAKWSRVLLVAALVVVGCGHGLAQTPGGFTPGQQLLAADLNAGLAAKQDYPCSTAPFGDNTIKCATTAFVQNAIDAVIVASPLVVGTSVITGGTNSYVFYDNLGTLGAFNLFGTTNLWTALQTFNAGVAIKGSNSPAVPVVNVTYGSSGTPFSTDPAYGYYVDKCVVYATPGTGSAEAITACLYGESHLSAGTRGQPVGVAGYAFTDGTWSDGSSINAGPVAFIGAGQSSVGGSVWGYAIGANCITTACNYIQNELDIENIAGTGTINGLIINLTGNSTGSITGTWSLNGGGTTPSSTAFNAQVSTGSATPWDKILTSIKQSGGAAPISATGTLLYFGGGYTVGTVLETSTLTISNYLIHGGVFDVTGAGAIDAAGTASFFGTAIGATSTDRIILANLAPAAAGAQQWSPRVQWLGYGWKTNATAASQQVNFIAELQTVQGTAAPSGELVFSSQVNAGGYVPVLSLGGGVAIGASTADPGVGGLAASGLTNVATTSSVCYNTSTGLLSYDGTLGTCNTSSLRYKHDVETLGTSELLAGLMKMRPVSFFYNDDQNSPGQFLGLIAEEADKIDSRLVGYDDWGRPNSIRWLGGMSSYLIGSIQELDRNFEQSRYENDNREQRIAKLEVELATLKAANDNVERCLESLRCRIGGR